MHAYADIHPPKNHRIYEENRLQFKFQFVDHLRLPASDFQLALSLSVQLYFSYAYAYIFVYLFVPTYPPTFCKLLHKNSCFTTLFVTSLKMKNSYAMLEGVKLQQC